MTANVRPATVGAAQLAIDLFGRDRVEIGDWGTAINVVGLTEDDFNAGKALLAKVVP